MSAANYTPPGALAAVARLTQHSGSGVPNGILAGRWVVHALTTTLGIVPGATVPVAMVACAVAVTLVLANVTALLAARLAGLVAVSRLSQEL